MSATTPLKIHDYRSPKNYQHKMHVIILWQTEGQWRPQPAHRRSYLYVDLTKIMLALCVDSVQIWELELWQYLHTSSLLHCLTSVIQLKLMFSLELLLPPPHTNLLLLPFYTLLIQFGLSCTYNMYSWFNCDWLYSCIFTYYLLHRRPVHLYS